MTVRAAGEDMITVPEGGRVVMNRYVIIDLLDKFWPTDMSVCPDRWT